MEKPTVARDKITQAYMGKWGGDATHQKAKRRIDWLAKNAIGPEILDIGCSEGILPILLGREGNRVKGIDVNSEALSFAEDVLEKESSAVQQNISFHLANILSPDDSLTTYNTVIIAEVVEHLFHPETAIENAVQLVKPEGRLLLTTPFGYFPDPDHHQTFTLTSIVRMVEGFCTVTDLSVVDGYIRLVGKRADNSLPDVRQSFSTEDLLRITEKATLDAQTNLRESLADSYEMRLQLVSKNKELNRIIEEFKNKNQVNHNKVQELQKKIQEHDEQLRHLTQELDRSNRLYRDCASNNRKLHQLAQEKNQEISSQRNKIQQYHKELQALSIKIRQVNNKLHVTKNSEAWKIGYVTVKAFRTPGLNTLLWIPRLIKIAWQRRTRSPEKITKGKPVQAVQAPQAPVPLPPVIEVKSVPPVSINKSGSYRLRKEVVPPNDLTELRVACIMDQFTHNAFAPECQLLQLTPYSWQGEIEQLKPDMLFIESAWQGFNGLWNRKVNYLGGELSEIIAWCNRNEVPTVFWNKEDPVHFQTFIDRAQMFDFVFTTDIDTICSYKKALGHERVYLLPFAAQPSLHNPVEKFDRKDAFCFAGAYYPRYPDRMKDFETFFHVLSQEQGFDIYDRNYNDPDSEFTFPGKFRANIIGYLPHDEIDLAYKGYRYGINMNSIKQSPSMFARRVFELMCSNTVTVSNYSRGVRDFFGDLVISTDDGGNLKTLLAPFRSNTVYYNKVRLAGLRKTLSEHTYRERLSYIAEKVWKLPPQDHLPNVTVIANASGQKQLTSIISNFERQNYRNKQLLLVLESDLQPEDLDKNYRIITSKDGNTDRLERHVQHDFTAYFSHRDYYGPNYLLDIMLAYQYVEADAVGKNTIHEFNQDSFTLQDSGHEYRYVEHLPCRSSVVKTKSLGEMSITSLLKQLSTGTLSISPCFAVDAFNYCKEFTGTSCPEVDDLPDLNIGLSLRAILKNAEQLSPIPQQVTLTQLEGSELMGLLARDPSGLVRLSKKRDELQVHSMLEGERSVVIKGDKFIRMEQPTQDRGLQVYLDTNPGLHIQMMLFFFDENCQQLAHRKLDGNRNYLFPSPAFSYLKIGLQITGKGNGSINRVVFDHITRTIPYHRKSDTLLLTPQYPAYNDLYRFGFVHSRVVQYRQLGLTVDVLRCNNWFPEYYYEFNNIDVRSGSTDTLEQALTGGGYSSILVHYLTQAKWNCLRTHVGEVPIVIWLHGAEVQPWYRRKFNYSTDAEKQEAIALSDKRIALWRDVFSNLNNGLHFVFVSQYFANEVMEDIGIRLPKANYTIIHNTVNTDLFAFQKKKKGQRKKILSIRPYASAKYANDLAVKAILELSTQPFFPELEFRLIGDGPLFDETLQPVREFSNVIVEKQFLKHEEIAKLHREYGIFLTPTRMDAQGVSRDEAMSSGLVPITNNITAIPEFVDNQCGMLVDGEDYKGLAAAIKQLYQDPELFLRLSENAAARVRRQSSVKKTVGKELELIRSMMNGTIPA